MQSCSSKPQRCARTMLAAGMVKDDRLETEARRFGRYLGSGNLPEDLVDRYCEANRALFPGRPSPEDLAFLAFVRQHAWSLPVLESALGLIRPDALLRRKLVVLVAIIETDPRFANRFEALAPGRANAVLRLLGLGLSSAFKLTCGILLYPIVKLHGTGRTGPRRGEAA